MIGRISVAGRPHRENLPVSLPRRLQKIREPVGFPSPVSYTHLFLKDSWTIDQTVMLAAVVLSVIPPAIVYITCQKFLLQGVITSGLKS